MIQRLLQLLTLLDWTVLLRAPINNQRHMGHAAGVGAHIIRYPLASESQALAVLAARRITHWNASRFRDTAQIWVKEEQAGLAELALAQAGIATVERDEP